MKNILFLAPYPNKQNEKDGMISRVKYIDNMFKDKERNYLCVHLKNGINKIDNQGLVTACDLNIFPYMWKILNLLKRSDFIYCHSVYSASFVWFLLIFCKRPKIVLDIHGVVPEEEQYRGRKFRALYLRFVEWFLFHRIKVAICVTKAMENEYRVKYKWAKCKFLIYGIVPVNLCNDRYDVKLGDYHSDKIEIIYSGGVQKWQNINLMLNTIKQNLFSNVHYTILTGDMEFVKQKAKLLGIKERDLLVTSCEPSELSSYYAKAHYAFILRDDNIVNRVANPTKLIEYLFYGLTPIVLSPWIGDYVDMGYDYIRVENFSSAKLRATKSENNRKIALALLEKNRQIDFVDFLLSSIGYSK